VISTDYKLRYRAKNIFGWSDYSEITSIFTVMVPDVTGDAIEAEVVGTNVIFSWTAPDDRGTAITHYNVQIEIYLGTYILDETYCRYIAQLTCSVPMSLLSDMDGLFQLPVDTLIKV
jgi:hypothetical protein